MKKTSKKLVAVRIDPSAWHKARVAAVTASKTLGAWLEEAIREKADWEKGRDDVTETDS
jgi:predicted HicB family RNase H-like nuclease